MSPTSGTTDTASRRSKHDAVKVLLVEDEEAVAQMYRLRLVADGYEVVVAADGEAGLQAAFEEDPGFIFLDLRLPKLSGMELLARLRSNPATREIPVIVLTNMSDPELTYRGNQLGVVEYMIKAETTPTQLSLRLAEHQRRTEAT
jgi:DNA-binding response OmpR family regulator